MTCHFPDCLDIEAAMQPPIPDDIRAIIADVVPHTDRARADLAERLAREAMAREARHAD